MKRLVFLALAGCAGAPAAPTVIDSASAREQVRQAEIAFAAAFRDRDGTRFFAMVADDTVFLGPKSTLRGKRQMMEVWSRFLAAPAPPFSWRPERVEVSEGGTLGLSIGPVSDPSGVVIGSFASVWRRQPDGSWKVLFDGPGCSVPAPTHELSP